MDDPSTLRSKAARFFENAAFSTSPEQAEKLRELGQQLELWADDLEEIQDALKQKTQSRRQMDDNLL